MALVLPETTVGMTEASITRSPSIPLHPQLGVDHRHRAGPHHAGAGLVEGGAGGCADMVEQILVGLRLRARAEFLGDELLHRRGREDAARDTAARRPWCPCRAWVDR